MKKSFIALIVVATATLGLLVLLQSRRLANQQEQLAAARNEQEQTSREAEKLQAANQRLEQERASLRDQLPDATTPNPAVQTAAPVRAIAEDPASADPGKAENDSTGMGKFLAKIMEDPDTRKFIRDQQRQMMDTHYAPLMKQLGLTPEESGQFKDFLADTQMKGAEKATTLFDSSSSNRTEVLTALTSEQRSADEQIRAFLGDERYASYQDYQMTLGERMQLAQFNVQTAGTEGALSDQQTETLLALMREEKQNAATLSGQTLPGAGQNAASMQAMLSGEQGERLLQTQELANQRVFERARSVLPESQLNTFGRFQTNQLQMLRLGMSMARRMFAPEGGTAQPGQ